MANYCINSKPHSSLLENPFSDCFLIVVCAAQHIKNLLNQTQFLLFLISFSEDQVDNNTKDQRNCDLCKLNFADLKCHTSDTCDEDN